jgi:hypothetical protein
MFENFTITRLGLYTAMFAATSLAQSFTAASVAPSDPVLSIDGMCREAKEVSFPSGDCTVAISRRQFEDLLSVLSPRGQAAPIAKDRFARTYAELLAFDHAARELGIDESPQYQETMRWVAANTLADLLRRRLEMESGVVSEAEADAYYREHLSQFEEVKRRRLVLPKKELRGR